MGDKLEEKKKRLAVIQRRIADGVIKEKKIEGNIKRMERKARTRRLIEIGALLEKVGILEYDREFLVGCFLRIKAVDEGSEEWKMVRDSGGMFLECSEGKKAKGEVAFTPAMDG